MINKEFMLTNKKHNLNEEFDKDDMLQLLKKDKDIEKRIKEITTDVVTDLFRVLWQRKSTYENELKR